jgi:hypothetical protein
VAHSLANSHPVPGLTSQLEELGARKRYTHPVRAEIHEHSGLALDIENAAKAVLVVRHQITPLVNLGRFLDDGDIEGTTRQIPSTRGGARWFHFIHSTRIACLAAAKADSNSAALGVTDPLILALAATARAGSLSRQADRLPDWKRPREQPAGQVPAVMRRR